MSDIKSYQRLLAVQALYEFTINKRGIDDPLMNYFYTLLKIVILKIK